MAVDRSWRWIAWLITGIGLLILSGGLALGWGSLRHVLYGQRAYYTPVVRFGTSEGREIEFHGSAGSSAAFTQGERVTVIYDPANPIHARIVSFLDLWLPSAVAFAVTFLFGGSVLLSRWARRRWRAPRRIP